MSGSVLYRLGEENVVAAARRHSTVLLQRLRLGVAALAVALVVVLAATHLDFADPLLLALGAPLACLLLGLIIFLVLLRLNYVGIARRAFHERPAMQQEMTLAWDADMLSMLTSGSSRKGPIAELHKFGLWPDLIMLYPDPTTYIAVPADAFTAESLDDLKTVLLAAGIRRVGPRR